MKGIKFKGSRTMGAAPGMENCSDLPVKDQLYDGKYPGYESRWELTDEELERIQKSRTIILDIVHPQHPPVMLTVATERSELEEENIQAAIPQGYSEGTCSPPEQESKVAYVSPVRKPPGGQVRCG